MADSLSNPRPRLGFLQQPLPLATVLVLVLFLPFVGKAIHIDDIAFLNLGDMFAWNPLQATPQDYPYQGGVERNLLPYESTHPLLIPYLLKILRSVCGEREVLWHLAFLFFPWLSLVSLGRISAVLGEESTQRTGLLLVLFGSLPAFVVNGQNLMTDVPTLAFLLAGTAALLGSLADGAARDRLPWVAAFWLTCAIFTSYQAVAYLPVLAAYALQANRQPGGRWKYMAMLTLPVVLLLCWLGLVYENHGVFPLVQSQVHTSIGGEIKRGLQTDLIGKKIIYGLTMCGASVAFVLPFCVAWRVSAQNLLRNSCVFILLTGVGLGILPDELASNGQRIVFVFLFVLGALGLLAAGLKLRQCHRSGRQGMVVLCGGWLSVTLLVNVFLLPFGSARYLLPLFPLLFLLLLTAPPVAAGGPRPMKTVLLGMALLWGGATAWSDYAYADSYRVMAAEVSAFAAGQAEQPTVWYIGEWGMRYYFDRAGARYLPADSNLPRSGDYVVIPEMPRFWTPAAKLRARLEFYASRQFAGSLPLRLFNRRSNAGFYAHHWGWLPFSFATEPDEVFIVQKVR